MCSNNYIYDLHWRVMAALTIFSFCFHNWISSGCPSDSHHSWVIWEVNNSMVNYQKSKLLPINYLLEVDFTQEPGIYKYFHVYLHWLTALFLKCIHIFRYQLSYIQKSDNIWSWHIKCWRLQCFHMRHLLFNHSVSFLELDWRDNVICMVPYFPRFMFILKKGGNSWTASFDWKYPH